VATKKNYPLPPVNRWSKNSIMKPQNLKNIILRQQIISAIRHFFVQKKFQEIDLPVLKYSLPLEQNIYSLETSCKQIQDKLYLSTSPESGLKKIISQRPGNYFSISPSFRNLEAKGPTHQPEFLMLEWYQTNSNYLRTMKIVQNLIFNIAQGLDNIKYNRTNNILTYQNFNFDLSLPWPKISIKQLFLDHADIDLDLFLTSSKFSENNFNQIFLNDIEPHLSTSRPTFITPYTQKDLNYILDPLKSPMVIPKTTQWAKSLAPLCLKKNTADYTNYLLHPLITILLRLHPKCLISPDAVWELIGSPCYSATPPTLTPSGHSVFNLSSPSSSQLCHQATFTMRPFN